MLLYYNMETYDENDSPEIVDWSKIGNDLDSICMCISAKRRSGKTYLCRELCYHLGKQMKWDLVILFSETADFNDDFDYVSEYYKYNHYDEDILNRFIKQQETNMKIYKQKRKKNPRYDKEPPLLLIILDDVAHTKEVFFSRAIGQLAVLGRHIRCSCIVLTQHLCAFSPKFRQNCDILITFRDPDYNLKKYIIDSFMTLDVNSRKEVKPYIDKCFGEPFKAMVIMIYKIQEAYKLSDYVGYFKAGKNKPKFKLGQKEFWQKDLALRDKNSSKRKGLNTKDMDFKHIL